MRAAVEGIGLTGGFGAGVASLRSALEGASPAPRIVKIPFGSGEREAACLTAPTDELERFFPSTQLCSNPACNYRAKKSLAQRWHSCPQCGLILHRDVNAAQNNNQEGINYLVAEGRLDPRGAERRLCGDETSTEIQELLSAFESIPRVSASFVNEARSSLQNP